jgi:CBS domain-containing protein
MARTVEEIMTHDPRTVDADASLVDAAREMRDGDVGDVIVTENGQVSGILTDRDIVIRAIAEGRDPGSASVREVATRDVRALEPSQSVDEAVQTMREHDIRRLPVVDGGRPVGILSLGDLAVERDPDSALADISTGTPDR